MHPDIIRLLKCPSCGSQKLGYQALSEMDGERIIHGVVWCCDCNAWYPVEDGLLELLTPGLSYREDREKFARKYSGDLKRLGLESSLPPKESGDNTLQVRQQSHFDWYANNSKQSYSDYENTPFWIAADKLAFDPWRNEIKKGKWLLDIGCAQGRSTFKFMDLDINILGMDVSKNLVRQAIARCRQGNHRARATFIAADASSLPIADDMLDYVLIYGVLHHLPDPRKTCREVGRVLKPGGIYFGSENNVTVFRKVFDILQAIFPIWSEEAGPEALISRKYLLDSFSGTQVRIQTSTSVFLPPHLMNLTSPGNAYRWLKLFDTFCGRVPFVNNNGGLLLIRGQKHGCIDTPPDHRNGKNK